MAGAPRQVETMSLPKPKGELRCEALTFSHPETREPALKGVSFISQWPSADRGQHIGYLPQSVELFAATVRENIARMTDGDGDAVLRAAVSTTAAGHPSNPWDSRRPTTALSQALPKTM
jgi:ABC-type protease/lipase transport system fused ATPase/permease subunit